MVGTTFRDGTVVLRPTLLRRLMPAPSVAFATVISIALIGSAVGNGSGAVVATVVAGTLFVAATSWLTIVFMRSRVTASASGLTVRDRWRRRSWSWDEIERVGVDDAWPASLRGSPAFLLTWRMWPGESTPVLSLRDRSIAHLWILSSPRRDGSFSLGLPTPAEIHAGILARYHGLATSQPPTYVPAPRTA